MYENLRDLNLSNQRLANNINKRTCIVANNIWAVTGCWTLGHSMQKVKEAELKKQFVLSVTAAILWQLTATVLQNIRSNFTLLNSSVIRFLESFTRWATYCCKTFFNFLILVQWMCTYRGCNYINLTMHSFLQHGIGNLQHDHRHDGIQAPQCKKCTLALSLGEGILFLFLGGTKKKQCDKAKCTLEREKYHILSV